MKYLVFDIETVVDWDLVYETNREHGETREACISRFNAELIAKQGRDPAFVPARYHVPVSVAFIATDDLCRYVTHKVVGSLDAGFVTREFWALLGMATQPPMSITTLCSFNGIVFDMPVLEINAHRNHVKMPEWLVMHAKYASENPRSRYNENAHLDLFSFLSGPSGIGGNLDYWATLIGLPGKVCMSGGGVEDALKEENGLAKVNDYCMSDVLNTYGLLIHTRRTACEIDRDIEVAPHTYQMDAAIEAITSDPQWVDGGCVHRWAQAYRAGKSGAVDAEEPTV